MNPESVDSSCHAITLILPTKNEAEGIASIIDGSRKFADEIIVVDGHSTDGTILEAEKAGADKVFLDEGTGKGNAYQCGVRAATHEIIVFMDADGSHDPSIIPLLVAPIIAGQADFVVGSRIKGGSDELHGDVDNFLRAVGSGIITTAINLRFKSSITDALNGYRAIRKSVFRQLELNCSDFDIEQHMICRALGKKFRLVEVPAHEYRRKWGRSKLPTFKKAHLFLWRLCRDLF